MSDYPEGSLVGVGVFSTVGNALRLVDSWTRANIGSWTHSVLSIVPTASVLAVEPAGQPLETLRARYGHDRRVETVAVAIRDRSGTAEFHVTEHSHDSSLHPPRDMRSDYGSACADG